LFDRFETVGYLFQSGAAQIGVDDPIDLRWLQPAEHAPGGSRNLKGASTGFTV